MDTANLEVSVEEGVVALITREVEAAILAGLQVVQVLEVEVPIM